MKIHTQPLGHMSCSSEELRFGQKRICNLNVPHENSHTTPRTHELFKWRIKIWSKVYMQSKCTNMKIHTQPPGHMSCSSGELRFGQKCICNLNVPT